VANTEEALSNPEVDIFLNSIKRTKDTTPAEKAPAAKE
jgi:hypothetical protein